MIKSAAVIAAEGLSAQEATDTACFAAVVTDSWHNIVLTA
jgi:hypothetical protein